MVIGLRSPFTIGQSLFWHLRSEMHDPQLFTLYGMFLRQYLHRSEVRLHIIGHARIKNVGKYKSCMV